MNWIWVKFEFHYDYIKTKYGYNWRLLFIDTDTLRYEIKTEDVYEEFSEDKEMFYFSNYSAMSKHYDDSNKLAVGKIKYETAGVDIKEFVGLNLRIHSFLENSNCEHQNKKVSMK